eukprot:scaffold3849_cov179-Amphora_coffeaeformis.AAC.18
MTIMKGYIVAAFAGQHVMASSLHDARDLIIGGFGLPPEYYRFFSRLQSGEGNCGASMIAPDLLLTAGHCVLPPTAEVGYFSNSDIFETINIVEGFKHPGFDPITLSYDFQIVRLASEAANPAIIELNADPAVPSDTDTLVIMGIGDSNPGSSIGTATNFAVQAGTTALETDDACQATRGFSVSYADSLYESMFCAIRSYGETPNNGATNACSGDGGGPLLAVDYTSEEVVEESYVGIQVGVISWGYDSCSSGNRYPRVNSRVSTGFDWIKYIVCTQSANPPTYFACTGNELEPSGFVNPSPPEPSNPIGFRYSIPTNFFTFENGIRIEAVGSIRPDTIQHVVPSALPTNEVFTQTLDLEEGELYAFTIVDTSGDGIQSSAAPITLGMAQSTGIFTTFETIQPDFGDVAVIFFYATPSGTVADPFDAPNSYPDQTILTLEMVLDAYPEEVSIQLTSGPQTIWSRPFRYYTGRSMETITEEIAIPIDAPRDFRLTVRDSSGDGIGETAYTLSLGNEVLVQDSFVNGGTISSQFSFDPSEYATASPTDAPTVTPENDSDASQTSPTSTPTEDPPGDTGRDTSSATFLYSGTVPGLLLGGVALSAFVSGWLLQ